MFSVFQSVTFRHVSTQHVRFIAQVVKRHPQPTAAGTFYRAQAESRAQTREDVDLVLDSAVDMNATIVLDVRSISPQSSPQSRASALHKSQVRRTPASLPVQLIPEVIACRFERDIALLARGPVRDRVARLEQLVGCAHRLEVRRGHDELVH